MFHTAFVHDNVIRLLRKDIDFTKNFKVSENFFLDLILDD